MSSCILVREAWQEPRLQVNQGLLQTDPSIAVVSSDVLLSVSFLLAQCLLLSHLLDSFPLKVPANHTIMSIQY